MKEIVWFRFIVFTIILVFVYAAVLDKLGRKLDESYFGMIGISSIALTAIYSFLSIYISNKLEEKKLRELREKCPAIAPFDLQRINYQTLGRVEGSGYPRKAEIKLLKKAVKLGANAIVLEADHRTSYSGYTGDSLRRDFGGNYYVKKGESYSGVTSDMSGYAIRILD